MRSFALCTLAFALASPACVKIDDIDPTLSTLSNTLTSSSSDGTGSGTGTGTGTTENGTGTGTGTSEGTVEPTTEPPTTGDPSTGPGSSTGPGTGSSTGGMGGALYGPCEMSNPPCPEGQDCLMVQGVEGNFCSPKCDGMTCPANPDGSAMAVCALTMEGSMDPVNCALLCNPMGMNECPAGSTCKAVPMTMAAVCTYP